MARVGAVGCECGLDVEMMCGASFRRSENELHGAVEKNQNVAALGLLVPSPLAYSTRVRIEWFTNGHQLLLHADLDLESPTRISTHTANYFCTYCSDVRACTCGCLAVLTVARNSAKSYTEDILYTACAIYCVLCCVCNLVPTTRTSRVCTSLTIDLNVHLCSDIQSSLT
jgi:hypothetical protein